ncbi:hypothetical protein [Methylobacterium gnaphalii]|uniref:Uncharacterized protein n=1 Tax=Methylobacterium gnaphalii TaxID=1010610 RepID=A0A512JRG5_9HYPH|nr:hypothetical protein [Methylobacterium gnaphalii]GEP12544.1 hypothetical protein MGN01_43890 [Methylobacterium gnaphalii]GJD70206.1 hypothetical protein MMMDOFMJ_3148 [Methylobacterium gnaphalii]GLS51517.1 hypothetical protein GCM10007885_43750 [Methylobacterium gnaphalii]
MNDKELIDAIVQGAQTQTAQVAQERNRVAASQQALLDQRAKAKAHLPAFESEFGKLIESINVATAAGGIRLSVSKAPAIGDLTRVDPSTLSTITVSVERGSRSTWRQTMTLKVRQGGTAEVTHQGIHTEIAKPTLDILNSPIDDFRRAVLLFFRAATQPVV